MIPGILSRRGGQENAFDMRQLSVAAQGRVGLIEGYGAIHVLASRRSEPVSRRASGFRRLGTNLSVRPSRMGESSCNPASFGVFVHAGVVGSQRPLSAYRAGFLSLSRASTDGVSEDVGGVWARSR